MLDMHGVTGSSPVSPTIFYLLTNTSFLMFCHHSFEALVSCSVAFIVRIMGNGRIEGFPLRRSEGRFITLRFPLASLMPITLLPPPSMLVAFQQPSSIIMLPSSCRFMPWLYFHWRPSTTTNQSCWPVLSTPIAVLG